MENESKTYVIYNVMPPYAKATGASASETHANPSSSAPSIESANQEHVLKQSKSENVKIRTEGTKKTKRHNLCAECLADLLASICARIIIFIIAGIIAAITVTLIKYLD